VSTPATISEAACHVLNSANAQDKVRLTSRFAQMWRNGEILERGTSAPPERPARPAKPVVCAPAQMPKRSTGGGKRRVHLVHAIAHIELNAIDLAWDIVARFGGADQMPPLPRAFLDDWVNVADDEARHFDLLCARLHDLGAVYGDFPAHDGLWEAATKTAHDLLARLALVPMILEARGLDTTGPTVKKLRANGDHATADILQHIADEEISHVAAGVRWFEFTCKQRALDPQPTFKTLLGEHFKGQLKPPFNVAARTTAGLHEGYYQA